MEKRILKSIPIYNLKINKQQSNRIDTFEGLYRDYDLIKPYISFYNFCKILEEVPEHFACVRQKSIDYISDYDIVFNGENETEKNIEEKKIIKKFFKNCNPEKDLLEILRNIVVDYEALGNGYLEIVRDLLDKPVLLNHIPAVNVRITKNKKLYCQVINSKKRFFKSFGIKENYNKNTGLIQENISQTEKASEIIQFKKPSIIDDYYGIPCILSVATELLCNLEIIKYNLNFFQNNAMPNYFIHIKGDNIDVSELKEDIKNYFNLQAKENIHTPFLLPYPADIEIKLEALNKEIKEAGFRNFQNDNREIILMSHQMPPYRIGIIKVGALGGNVAEEQNKIYINSVVYPEQAFFENKITKSIIEQCFNFSNLKINFKKIDIQDKDLEAKITQVLMQNKVITINEARQYWQKPPIEGGDVILLNTATGTQPIDIFSQKFITEKNSFIENENKIIELNKKYNQEKFLKNIIIKFRDIFENEKDFIISQLYKQKEKFIKKLFFQKTTLNINEIIFDKEKEVEKIIKTIDKDLNNIFEKTIKNISQALKIDVIFNLKDPVAREFMNKWKLKLAGDVVNTTTEQITEQLVIGIDKGYSINKIVRGFEKDNYKGIKNVFADAIKNRAEMIARTELNRATSEASLLVYRKSGLVESVELDLAEDACDLCQEYNGKQLSLEEASGLLPIHPNCVCSYSPSIKQKRKK